MKPTFKIDKEENMALNINYNIDIYNILKERKENQMADIIFRKA